MAKRAQRRAPSPDPLEVFIGDEHVGSLFGPAPKPLQTTREQAWLTTRLSETIARIKQEARGKALVLRQGGDAIDGVNHHNTAFTWGTAREQRNAAVELLMPLANVASAIYSVDGTAAHVGEAGDDDRTVAQMLGAKPENIRPEMVTVTAGRKLNWAHHGVVTSAIPWNELNGLRTLAEKLYWRALQHKLDPPALVVRHDRHFSPPPIYWREMWAALCPCWQLTTPYGHGFGDPDRVPDIGVLVWWPREHRLERWLHDTTKIAPR